MHGIETVRDFQVGLTQAWHRLTIVKPVISASDFPQIVAAPLTYVSGGELKPWPGMSVPVSTDDGLPVGTAFGASYALFTPQDAMAYLEEVLSGTGYKVLSLGMVFNRSRWFVSFELVELAGIAPAGESFILSASGGLDKSQSPMFNLCHVVQVCANTVRLARAGRALFSSKLTKGFTSRLEASRAALGEVVGMARLFNETLRGLEATRATVDEARAVYAAELSGNGADLRSTRSLNTLDDLVAGFRGGRGNSGATRLDVVNGFTEVLGQGLAGSASKRDAFSRWESSEWGGNADRKAAFVDGITAPGGWDLMVSTGNGAMADARRNTVTVA
jgi:hypothetical protein